MEQRFLSINRIADLCWEKEKIVFEIQCSFLSLQEAENRIQDYGSLGYEVVWLLDDRKFNRYRAGPTELFLRKGPAYYFSLKQGLQSQYYDQFEIFAENRRVRKGSKLTIDLRRVKKMPNVSFNEKIYPKQITERKCKHYFF